VLRPVNIFSIKTNNIISYRRCLKEEFYSAYYTSAVEVTLSPFSTIQEDFLKVTWSIELRPQTEESIFSFRSIVFVKPETHAQVNAFILVNIYLHAYTQGRQSGLKLGVSWVLL